MKRTLTALALVAAPIAVSAAVPAAAQPGSDARADFRKLRQEYREAMDEYHARLAGLDEAEAAEFRESWNPTSAFVAYFAEKAAEYAGTDDAPSFLIWILRNDVAAEGGLPEGASKALETLLDAHATNEEFLGYVEQIGRGAHYYGKARCQAVLERVVAGAKDDELRRRAVFARGVAYMVGEATDEDRERARADLLAVLEECDEKSELAASIAGFLFELDNLQIGQVAPDISGADLDGAPFKLSDYRGKVVLLDFWGDW